MQLKIGAYIRVSTEEQAQLFEGSLDSQQYQLKQFVDGKNKEQRDWGKIVEFYIDDGHSAATTNRPAFQRMLQDLRKKKIDLILVTDLSRLSRNISDFCGLLEELKEIDANFISMRQSFLDTSTPGGRMMVHMMVTMGQFEREQTAERVSINCHSRAMRGYMNGGKAVLGYKRDPLKPGTLIVDEDEAKIVRLIFKTYLAEGTRAKTIRRLHEMGVYPKQRLKNQDVQAVSVLRHSLHFIPET